MPYIVVVKVGIDSEINKPGNRGKRDTQLLFMRYLSRCNLKSEMNPLELEITHHMKFNLGLDPAFYEFVLWVDSDTELVPDAINRLVSCMSRDSRVCIENLADNIF